MSFGWDVNWGYLFLQLLYFPAVLLSWVTGICAIVLLTRKGNRTLPALALALALPMMGYALYHPRYGTMKSWHASETMQSEWWDGSQILSHLLHKYVRDHRDQIKWTGNGEEIDASGFLDYLKTYPPLYYWSREGPGARIRLTKTEVLAPWGSPLVFAVDRDGDGYLDVLGKKRSLKRGYADPWGDGNFSYSVGVGCAPTNVPESIFDPGANYIEAMDDGEFARLYEYRESQIKGR